MNLLSVENVSVKAKHSERPLLNDVSFKLDGGEVICIVGPNGAGKSTLLKTISGDLACNSGSIIFENISDTPRLRARQFAVLPQFSLLNFPYRVYEVVGLGRVPHQSGQSKDHEIIHHCMAMMDIKALEQRRYTTLSGGEKQRVQLARVVAQLWSDESHDAPPRILLLDEPTTALDLGHQQMLMHTLRELAELGIGIIMVLHDVNLAARYADKILALQLGELLAFGTPGEVITKTNMERLFGTKLTVVPHPHHLSPIVVSADG